MADYELGLTDNITASAVQTDKLPPFVRGKE